MISLPKISNMVGILVELLLSYLLLRYFADKNLKVLGLMPNGKRLLHLLTGILWPVIWYCTFEFVLSLMVHNPYHINPQYDTRTFISSLFFLFRTVGYEELLFRGALLYLLIRKIGSQKAILVSSAAFGVYHWFAWNAFGNPMQMLVIFLTTGSGGLLFALAFQRTKSMYLPAGLHLGADVATMVIFSKSTALGSQWLEKSFIQDPVVPAAVISVPMLIIHFVGFQVFTLIFLRRFASGAAGDYSHHKNTSVY